LIQGVYWLEVDKTGFKRQTRDQVNVGGEMRVDVRVNHVRQYSPNYPDSVSVNESQIRSACTIAPIQKLAEDRCRLRGERV
jgi:hypothetical protein